MRKYFLNLIFAIWAISSISVNAELLTKESIPEKIMTEIYKRHPDALKIKAEQKKHFGQELYAIYIKEGENNLIEFYRPTGHFFVSGEKIEGFKMLPPEVEDNLKTAFTTYEIKEAILIPNPNGSGEEYDLSVDSSGNTYSVSVSGKGNIIKKVRY
ncbi:conserved hypothetical protein [Candidatus Methylobacter favarea]|uniref:Uncharacterized protein n=1 Tax=Candidatus Methylobacter favarea TaxID=2707345 RepID=A0A8S0WAG2_9GAMM|nr:hypothetical protein [Candidatus Methylobacter favarea]CAA9890719.1 conserved hypothetical protein [Candidatus Methylobacter favarea]